MIRNRLNLTLESLADELRSYGLLISAQISKQGQSFLRLATDSRRTTPNDLFLAYRGLTVDGHLFLKDLADKGILLFIIDRPETALPPNVSYLLVTDARAAWAVAAAALTGHPERSMRLIAITGTNGKTSTAWYVHQLLHQNGIKSGYIGTLGAEIINVKISTRHTTPDPPDLFEILEKMRGAGVSVCAMEASSQALAHGRLAPFKFHSAAFTSFSRDHLDFHGSMEHYLDAKSALFEKHLEKNAKILLCTSIQSALSGRDANWKNVSWYGIDAFSSTVGHKNVADIRIERRELQKTSIKLTVDAKFEQMSVPVIGDHSVENFVAAMLLAEDTTGSKLIRSSLLEVLGVPGRCELIKSETSKNSPTAIVDYAHTPDGLEKILTSLRQYTAGTLVVVFGCGGDRDRGKRPLMGEIASNLADLVIITSDNPRNESPALIISEILVGCKRSARQTPVFIEEDREKAINLAITKAIPGDIVLIAGKGHEDYQIVGGSRRNFDDRLCARTALSKFV